MNCVFSMRSMEKVLPTELQPKSPVEGLSALSDNCCVSPPPPSERAVSWDFPKAQHLMAGDGTGRCSQVLPEFHLPSVCPTPQLQSGMRTHTPQFIDEELSPVDLVGWSQESNQHLCVN